MKDKLKSFLLNSYALIVTPLIVATISPFLISWIKKIDIKQSTVLMINFIKIKTNAFFNYRIPVWVILIIIFLLFLFYKIRAFRKDEEYPDWYYNFRNIKFKEWFFSWKYNIFFEIINLKPICSCKCDLVQKSKIGNSYYSSPRLYCPNCGNIYNVPDHNEIEELKCLIIHRANTNIYKK